MRACAVCLAGMKSPGAAASVIQPASALSVLCPSCVRPVPAKGEGHRNGGQGHLLGPKGQKKGQEADTSGEQRAAHPVPLPVVFLCCRGAVQTYLSQPLMLPFRLLSLPALLKREERERLE